MLEDVTFPVTVRCALAVIMSGESVTDIGIVYGLLESGPLHDKPSTTLILSVDLRETPVRVMKNGMLTTAARGKMFVMYGCKIFSCPTSWYSAPKSER